MTPETFSFYKKYLHEKSGLSLDEDKIYLLESRLTPVMRKWMFGNMAELTKALCTTPDRKLVTEVIDAMTTNETLFFRDDRPFKQFRSAILPALLKARENKRSLRIWSAACSTGQEPYSIAMILRETLPAHENWHIDIQATDLCETVLARAAKGEFSQFEIQRGLPIQMAMKYFKQDGVNWKIDDKTRNMVRFEKFNLLDRMDRLGTFDIVFCRNVLIYFDEETKKKVLCAISGRLAPDGCLFLGGSETVIGLCPDLKNNPSCPGLYNLRQMDQAEGLNKVLVSI